MSTETKTAEIGTPGPSPSLPQDGGPLPRGRHGIPDEIVIANQRRRLLVAAAEIHYECGYAATNVGEISTRAGVSRATFYKLFRGKPDCLGAAQRDASDNFLSQLSAALEPSMPWPAAVDAGVGATLAFAAAAPQQAFLLTSDELLFEPHLARTLQALRGSLVPLLRRGRRFVDDGATPPQLIELTLIAGIGSLIHAELRSGRAAELPAFRAQLVQIILMPFLGRAEAARLAGSRS